jgi:hypothetical protein
MCICWLVIFSESKVLNAIKPLISVQSAILIFIVIIIVIRILPQFASVCLSSTTTDSFESYSTLSVIHIQNACCSLYVVSQSQMANLVAIPREMHRKDAYIDRPQQSVKQCTAVQYQF